MMKWIICLWTVVLASGCICCGFGDYLEDGEVSGSECPPPYMEHGTGCCLDADANSICDSDETAETTVPSPPTLPAESAQTTQTVQATQTTQAQPITTTLATTTTVKSYKSTYDCVKRAGYDQDSFIMVFSKGCGSKYTDEARTASSRKGVELTLVDIGYLEEEEIRLLECFYGGYYEGNRQFSYCPRLLCPKTGEIEDVRGMGTPIMTQMTRFAVNCR